MRLWRAFIVCAIMTSFWDFAASCIAESAPIYRGVVLDKSEPFDLKPELSSALHVCVEPIVIFNFTNEISKSLPVSGFLNVVFLEKAIRRHTIVWWDDLSVFREFFVVQKNKRISHFLIRGCAFNEKTEVFCGSGPCVFEPNRHQHTRSWFSVNNSWGKTVHIEKYESTFANNIIGSNKVSLISSNDRISRDKQESCYADIIIWFAPITLFLIAGLGIGHGFKMRSGAGFVIVVLSLIPAFLGSDILLGWLLHLPPLSAMFTNRLGISL